MWLPLVALMQSIMATPQKVPKMPKLEWPLPIHIHCVGTLRVQEQTTEQGAGYTAVKCSGNTTDLQCHLVGLHSDVVSTFQQQPVDPQQTTPNDQKYHELTCNCLTLSSEDYQVGGGGGGYTESTQKFVLSAPFSRFSLRGIFQYIPNMSYYRPM